MIFEGVLDKENNFTEILKNLCQYKLFKKNFLDFLEIKYDNIDDVNIETQYNLSNNGIVDMYIENEGDSKNQIYLIEIKIKNDTSLSKHQSKKDYEEWAKNNKAIVKYLIPKNYKYIDKLEKYQTYFLEDFIKNIKISGIYELNQYIRDFVDFYYQFLFISKSYFFSKREIQLIKGEKMKEIDMLKDVTLPELMEKLFGIVDDVAEKVGYKISKDNKSRWQYGFSLKENENIWFGIYYEAWKKSKKPFIIWIYEEDLNPKLKEKLEKIGFEAYEDENEDPAYVYFFSLEEMKNLENFVNKINETKEILKEGNT